MEPLTFALRSLAEVGFNQALIEDYSKEILVMVSLAIIQVGKKATCKDCLLLCYGQSDNFNIYKQYNNARYSLQKITQAEYK